MKKLLLLGLIAMFITFNLQSFKFNIQCCSAQDPEFSQFFANPLYLNPAYAGSVRCPRICLNFRDQWPAIPGTYVTYCASYDQYIDAISGGLGIQFEQDESGQGVLTTTNASLIYSYHMDVSRKFSINAGFQGTYRQVTLDQNKLTFGDEINPVYGFIYSTGEVLTRTSVAMPDFSAGLLGYGQNVYFGISADHLTQPNESFLGTSSPLPIKFSGNFGAMIPVNTRSTFEEDQLTISPNILFMQQAQFQQLDLGFYGIKGSVVGGLWYRNAEGTSDAVIVLIGIQEKTFKFGYSYDITVSRLTEATGGAHELSLIFQFQCRPKHHQYRLINCPSF